MINKKVIALGFILILTAGVAVILTQKKDGSTPSDVATIEAPVAAATTEQPQQSSVDDTNRQFGTLPGKITLQSAQMKTGEKISLAYTCYQKNVSPPLNWSNWPAGTKSFALLFEKTDGGKPGSIYWTLYNIPASINSLAEALPKTATLGQGAMQGVNDSGNVGYYGPCLPKGEHRFVFMVFALDAILPLPAGADKTALLHAMDGHILDKGILPVTHYYRL